MSACKLRYGTVYVPNSPLMSVLRDLLCEATRVLWSHETGPTDLGGYTTLNPKPAAPRSASANNKFLDGGKPRLIEISDYDLHQIAREFRFRN